MNSYPLKELSAQWAKGGRHLGAANMPSCAVNDCHAMSFVALQTSHGKMSVCYRHYNLLHTPEVQ